MKKRWFGLTLMIGMFWISGGFTAEAEEGFTYDIIEGGEQTAYVETGIDEKMKITIEEIETVDSSKGMFRSLAAIQDKSYLIKGSLPFIYDASYKIKIKSKRITRAYDYSVSAVAGTVPYRRLTRYNNGLKAYLQFDIDHYILTTRRYQLTSTIEGNNLVVTPR